ncbi:MAG TPA: sulfite exporter TauE/SafE family protein [Alphaproteobacteria bacterium]|nr:sulfite exporter TauE/SafE family protein [Alphaproteobacteria bacterium]
MQVYLPIAELSANVFMLLGLGAVVGFLSGLFGVGGGFLMTPLLIFIGVPPTVAVSTQANQLVAASLSGVMAHWRRRAVDFRMGFVMMTGGLVGSSLGVWLFKHLSNLGQVELVISLSYVLLLGLVGLLMLAEAARALLRQRRQAPPKPRAGRHPYWVRVLPLKMRFYRSRIYISALVPLVIGLFVGVLVAIMGVGGGFIIVPAMIYILGMPTAVVAGTSLFQLIFITANVTFLEAVTTQTVDLLLALIMMVGGVLGAQFGVRASGGLKGEQVRALLALLVLAVAAKLLFDLVVPPADFFSIARAAG